VQPDGFPGPAQEANHGTALGTEGLHSTTRPVHQTQPNIQILEQHHLGTYTQPQHIINLTKWKMKKTLNKRTITSWH
jgi:hypothetical protein